MEALSRMLSKAMIRGYLSGFRVDLHNAAPLEIPHFLFQMTILFCDVDRDPFLNLGHILLCFEAILGLKATLENQN
jgi:hexokinase